MKKDSSTISGEELDALVALHTPSLADARPRSDRFRCGGRESKFLTEISIIISIWFFPR